MLLVSLLQRENRNSGGERAHLEFRPGKSWACAVLQVKEWPKA